MKKIILGSVFLVGGYLLIKNFLNKKSNVKLEKAKFEPKQTGMQIDVNGKTISIPLEQLEENYQHLRTLEDNIEFNRYGISTRDFKKGMTPEVVANLKKNPMFQKLNQFKPYQIDTSALKNIDFSNNPLAGLTQEQIELGIQKYRTGTPILPS